MFSEFPVAVALAIAVLGFFHLMNREKGISAIRLVDGMP